MSMAPSKSRLAGTTKELWRQWETCKNSWRDAKAQQFEKDYLEPVVDSVDLALTTIEQLDKIINKVRNDCK